MAEKKAKWRGYLRIPVNEEHVNNFHNWEHNHDAIAGLVGDCLADGYKFGLFFDAYADKVSCSMTCNDSSSKNGGYTFTTTAPSWTEALAFACYKHLVVAETEWPTDEAEAGGDYT